MMGKVKDITGQRFGKLIVIGISEQTEARGRIYWECRCDCGNILTTRADSLKSKRTVSCGCQNRENAHQKAVKNLLEKSNEMAKINHSKHDREGTRLPNLSEKITKTNKTGYKGVCYSRRDKYYMAYITFQRKRKYLGCYKTAEEAAKARSRAEEELFLPMIEKYSGKSNIVTNNAR